MLEFKRRTRMISFRLSDDEYEALKRCCANAGVRSLSEFARLAVSDMLKANTPPSDDGFQASLSDLPRAISQLGEHIRALTASLQDARMGNGHSGNGSGLLD